MTDTEIDEAERDLTDVPQLMLINYVEYMNSYGIAPAEQIAFAVKTITDAAAGEFDTKH